MKKGTIHFIAGFLLGAAIFGGSLAFAAGTVAQTGTASVIVDGRAADIQGYAIDGSNYFKLRDIARELDFHVEWDGDNDVIHIDTSRVYDAGDTVPVQTGTAAMTIEEMRAEIVRLTNIERRNAGLQELAVLPALMDCAQAKVQDMFDNHYYGHRSPVYGTPGEMINSFVPGNRGVGENLAPWTQTPEEVIVGMMGSPGHRAIILDPRFTHIGVGVKEGAGGGYWWVLQFVVLD